MLSSNNNHMEKIMHLLHSKFYDICRRHSKIETWLCKDCLGDPFCESCLPEHRGHDVLQLFKASRKEVIRARDIKKFWNVSDIQPFIVNATNVVYIHERKTKGDPKCRICGGHKLEEKYAFCSVECQIRSLQTEGNISCYDESVAKRVASSSSPSMCDEAVNSSSNGLPVVKHERKGQPIRAPLY